MATGAKRFNVHDAKSKLSKLLELAHAGEEVLICKDGEPYARLVQLAKPEPRKPGWLGKFDIGPAFFEPLPEEELRLWEGLEEK